MTERTTILAPKAMAVWVGVLFRSKYPTVIWIEGKRKTLASYVQDVGAALSGRTNKAVQVGVEEREPRPDNYEHVTYSTECAFDDTGNEIPVPPEMHERFGAAFERSMEQT